MKADERIEEALEKLWEYLEENSVSAEAAEAYLREELGTPLEILVQSGLIESSKGKPCFTPAGREAARQAIRRHRLSERLFSDIIETGHEEMEEAACQVEHIVKWEVEEKICGLLGHPKTCPHGKAIPSGDCCRKAMETGEKSVVPLNHLKKGESGVIAFIKAGDSKKLQKLMAMGVLPGNAIVLDRAFPSFVFSVGYSQYAVDKEMAGVIFVKRAAREDLSINREVPARDAVCPVKSRGI